MLRFPPRLPHQPIFYPVVNVEYARQIARDWNTVDEQSGFAGFVTAFEVDNIYLSKFEPHTVGAVQHVEYWIPAADLASFNHSIRGAIRLEDGFHGPAFVGYVPEAFGLKGKDAVTQFLVLHESWQHSTFDVACEVSANRKIVFLNWMFWAKHDFSASGISRDQRDMLLDRLKQCWELSHIEVPLPATRND